MRFGAVGEMRGFVDAGGAWGRVGALIFVRVGTRP